jgi:serine/threonine-protein kinase HipA
MQLLQGSSDKEDMALFLMIQLIFFLLAATDGHAKNFSLFLQPGDAYEMTPLYDILSTYPYFGNGPNQFNHRLAGPAMALRSKNVHKRYDTIHARHWYGLALKYGGQSAWDDMIELVESVDSTLEVIEMLLSKEFPVRTWEAISEGMRTAAKKFLNETGELPQS